MSVPVMASLESDNCISLPESKMNGHDPADGTQKDDFSSTEQDISDRAMMPSNGGPQAVRGFTSTHWRTLTEDISERCNLSGLAKNEMHYQASLWNVNSYVVQDIQSEKLAVDPSVLTALNGVCSTYKISHLSIILFAMHQTLHAYGRGTDTVIALSAVAWKHGYAFPSIFQHADTGLRCIDGIKDVEVTSSWGSSTNTEHALPLEQVGVELFDASFSHVDSSYAGATDDLTRLSPLSLIANQDKDSLSLTFTYDGSLFEQTAIGRLLSTLSGLLHQLAHPVSPINSLEYLPLPQKLQLEAWNLTDGAYPEQKLLHHLIEEAAARNPEKVSIVYRDVRVTYRELNERANQLARYLVDTVGVRPETLVALFADKSEVLIITILGVWKSGATYIPIDPSYPDERVRFTLADTAAQITIASQRHVSRLERRVIQGLDHAVQTLAIEPILSSLKDKDSVSRENLELGLTSKQLAYITYTSGTTGVPKGIYKEHRSVVNSITDLASRYGVTGNREAEVILLFASYVFEPFVRQTLMALVNSQLLAIIDDGEKLDSQKLQEFVKIHGVTYLNGTASVLREFDFSDCQSLRRLILVGEDLTETRYMELRRKFKHRIFNEYGFTESAFVTALKVFEPDSTRTNRSLGRPVRNVKCYILDQNLKQLPIGATGHLYVGGLGVARGYMNRPDLTQERFIHNPYQTADEKSRSINVLMYKTGDLARWLPNGEIEYIGRDDFQIKLRGIRIEPGEVESVLSQYPGLKTSVVVARDLGRGASKHLIGYYVPEPWGEMKEAELLAYLETKLPTYMIPTRLLKIPSIPVTINGKVDLRALPDVNLSERDTSVQVSLRNEQDHILSRIWSEILGIPKDVIGVESNFFRLGGHSISCIQLIGRIRHSLRLDVSIEDIFSSKTLGALSDRLVSGRVPFTLEQEPTELSYQTALASPALESSEVAGSFLANSLQQGFVYQYLKQGESDDAYVMQSLLTYSVKIEPEHFKMAWESAQRKYASLRLRFSWEKEVLQIVERFQTLNWRFVDLSDNTTEEESIREIQRNDKAERYHLGAGNLLRIYLLKIRANRFSCLFSCHHAILDGWSLPTLLEHVHRTYLQLSSGEKVAEHVDSAYIKVQAHIQAHRGDHADYWSNQISQIRERCNLNALLNEESRNKVLLGDYDQVREQREKTLIVEDAWTTQLKEICSSNGITLHSILQFVWHGVLHAYGGGTHTVIGTTISGRNLPIDDIERSVGLFINTLPLIVNHNKQHEATILDAIASIQSKTNEANSRGNVELGRFQMHDGELKHRLFDTLFVLENYPNLSKPDASIIEERLPFKCRNEAEKLTYPLAVIARETGDCKGFTFTLYYAGEIFDDTTIEELLNTVREIFLQIAANPSQAVMDLEYVGPSQQHKISAWNANEAKYPKDATLHQLFANEAARVPEKIAVVYENTRLTYQELNGRANKLAAHLHSLISKYEQQQLVALFMDKSEHMIISIIAVWKSGAGYVPIDPSYPEDRVTYILEDTAAKVIIADKGHEARLKAITNGSLDIVGLEEGTDGQFGHRGENLPVVVSSTDLAYIIYTSGTTGKPKGVMIEHKGVVNLHISLTKMFGLRDKNDEVILSFSNYVFDHFVEQMTDALLTGQTLLVLNDAMRGDKEWLYRYMSDNKVTYLSGTPSVISVYEYDQFASHLRRIDCVGEDFSEVAFNKIRSTFRGLIINGYGPTEVSITSHKRLYQFKDGRKDKSIGNQVANTTSYVLDANLKRVPIGAVGELFIGGAGVARGYHNRPQLTHERFLVNPFQSDKEKKEGKNGRIYRTGDLVRWLPNSDGQIEYLGRNDSQVKIRGLRIELGEIETVLATYPDISQSVVVVKNMEGVDQQYLVGYYVSDSAIAERDIKRHMRSKLPDYMVPNRLVHIANIPVTISGKLDVKSLPVVEFSSHEYKAPQNEIEMILCDIWSELLGIPAAHIGADDDFFSLGGDSLMSTKVSFMVTKLIGRQINIAALFKYKTIETLAQFILSGNEDPDDEIPTLSSIQDQNVPVSLSQEMMLFIDDFEGGMDAYNIAINLQLPKTVNRNSLKQSLRSVLSRHKTLRTLLPTQQKATQSTRLQYVLDDSRAGAMFFLNDFAVLNFDELDEKLAAASKYIFRLHSELPIKVDFYDIPQNTDWFYMAIVIHHIAFDALSWNVFQRDLEAFYNLHEGTTSMPNLPRLEVEYAEYAFWQRNVLLSESRLRALSDFWESKLAGFEQLNLISDYPRPRHFDYTGGNMQFSLDAVMTEGLRVVAKDLKVSLYSLLVGVYALMLGTYSNQRDFVIGAPMSNRNRPELENVVGFFVNMVVLRITIDPEATLAAHIVNVHRELIQAQLHKEMPFQRVVKQLSVNNDPSKHPIVQAIFNLESACTNGRPRPLLQMNNYLPQNAVGNTAKFDLSVTMIKDEQGFSGNFNFAASLFQEQTVKGWVWTYKNLLEQLSQSSAGKIKDLDLVGGESIDELAGNMSPPCSKTGAEVLHGIFEQEVEKSSEKEAVLFGGTKLTYLELNTRANQLARYLRRVVSIRPDDLVALVLDKSETMIVCILAIWKAGGAYVPIDPACPQELKAYVLADAGVKALITSRPYGRRMKDIAKVTLTIEVDAPSTMKIIEGQLLFNLDPQAGPTNLAYVIYTSGTTGKPKGVLVQHQGVASLRHSIATRYFGSMENQQGVMLLSNYVFDFSIEQICLSILSSNKLLIPPNNLSIDDDFYDFCNKNKLTYLSGTPTFLHQIDLRRLEHLYMVTSAGEELTKAQFSKIRREFAGLVNNAYGSTETTVYNSVKSFVGSASFENSLGQLLPNTKGYVLNDSLQLLPYGALGELYLSGHCVARGYRERPEMTAKRFLSNPFDDQKGIFDRIYKTGDLVRRFADGKLEYLGRDDFQVKLNGFRVELGEVQTIMGSFPGVKECAVLAKYDTTSPGSGHAKHLVAYFVPESDEVRSSEMELFLREKLPHYMVPASIVRIEGKFPVTVNGKLDTRALPEVDFSLARDAYSPPRNDVEKYLCGIWTSLLGIDDIGIDDDFFRLGGDSILSMQLISQVRVELELKITVKDLFDFKTIRKICENAFSRGGPTISGQSREWKVENGALEGRLPLLPIQDWFFAKKLSNHNHWNQWFAITVPDLDLERLKLALEVLRIHHDAFSLRFRKEGEEFIQYYDPNGGEIDLKTLEIRSLSDEGLLQDMLAHWQSGFDIENGPTSVVGYLHGCDDRSAIVWIAMHHLIVDTVSWRVLIRDLKTAYEGSKLGPKGSSYRQWTQAIQNYPRSEAELLYWEEVVKGMDSRSKNIPPTCALERASIGLTAAQTNDILRDCHRAYHTHINELLLTAFGCALQETLQSGTNYVVLEGHGREETPNPSLNISRTVGWFTTMYPFAIPPIEDLGIGIMNIKDGLRKVPNNGIGYGALFGYIKRPLPQISFNYLGQFEGGASTPGFWSLIVGDGGSGLSSATENLDTDNALLDVTGLCVKGQMSFNISSRLGAESTERFTTRFKAKLEQIIQHTLGARLAIDDFVPYFEYRNGARKGPILFLFPPGEGGAESYFTNIIRHLSRSNIISFNNLYLHANNVRKTFKDLAEYYIGYMRKLQPHGPYHLLGWSFGGVLSLEVSQQLIAAGEKIGGLMLIDSYFNVKKASVDIGFADKEDILDSIHYHYQPTHVNLDQVSASMGHIVLFRASKVNEVYRSDQQMKLYEYYMKAEYNLLDTIVDREKIRVIQMPDDTHFSWVKNDAQLARLCGVVLECVGPG